MTELFHISRSLKSIYTAFAATAHIHPIRDSSGKINKYSKLSSLYQLRGRFFQLLQYATHGLPAYKIEEHLCCCTDI
ncbi:MAG: hypothetical protein ACOH1I_01925 [Gallionellaceae bacterium]|jgi:hypothetical protein